MRVKDGTIAEQEVGANPMAGSEKRELSAGSRHPMGLTPQGLGPAQVIDPDADVTNRIYMWLPFDRGMPYDRTLAVDVFVSIPPEIPKAATQTRHKPDSRASKPHQPEQLPTPSIHREQGPLSDFPSIHLKTKFAVPVPLRVFVNKAQKIHRFPESALTIAQITISDTCPC